MKFKINENGNDLNIPNVEIWTLTMKYNKEKKITLFLNIFSIDYEY